ncbi:GNAT family N-acetyltransferase [Endozoicomonas montiporae]|uniref:GCN5-related N-acetyltransferase n=1 Tax=Endozoicomonas montiporae CL-33 TaxID=570277 RepID=A0A142BGF0_9GAMM|nr:GNAT family N-acetyltransferase [Endozoicomonas montiporae]AMO57826.1 GCN5-related N-acetyltransferase [Endozoicomonas montiporae CL-33]
MQFDLGGGYCVRSFLYGDASSLSRHGNNAKIARNLRDSFPNPYSIEHARAWIQHVKEYEADTRFIIASGQEAIGEIGFVTQLDVHRFSAEIGYWVSEEHWGKGIMSKAVAYVSDYAFAKKKIVRLFADVVEYNEGSCKVLERCGYQCEGVLRKHIYKGERFYDQFLYAKVNPNVS